MNLSQLIPSLLALTLASEDGLAALAAPKPPNSVSHHFTRWNETAALYGVHEVFLVRDHTPDRPFDLPAQVTFTPPSGAANARTVNAFYDGGNVWRARVYVTETGRWSLVSRCATDPKLDARQGAFEAVPASLRGRLLPHPRNPAQWITENGRWFLNLNDTAYLAFLGRDGLGDEVSFADFQHYIRDVRGQGLTSIRSMLACAYDSPQTSFFESNRLDQLDLERFQRTDSRLQWMLDPWQHPTSTGAHRGREFPFPDEPWATYLHLERSYDLEAEGAVAHRRWNKPVFNGEDRYESDHAESYDPFDMRYFQRRLFWSWLLSGGSANYGGEPNRPSQARPDTSQGIVCYGVVPAARRPGSTRPKGQRRRRYRDWSPVDRDGCRPPFAKYEGGCAPDEASHEVGLMEGKHESMG